jgi:hypothetical protein
MPSTAVPVAPAALKAAWSFGGVSPVPSPSRWHLQIESRLYVHRIEDNSFSTASSTVETNALRSLWHELSLNSPKRLGADLPCDLSSFIGPRCQSSAQNTSDRESHRDAHEQT